MCHSNMPYVNSRCQHTGLTELCLGLAGVLEERHDHPRRRAWQRNVLHQGGSCAGLPPGLLDLQTNWPDCFPLLTF